jgi:nitrite reductase (NADH) small subunit
MDTMVRVARLSEIPARGGLAREVNGRPIALFLRDGRVHAVSNLCPHQHVPAIAEGEFDGSVVTCPMHGWTFDVRSGRAVDGGGCLEVFKTRIEGSEVFVMVPPEREPAW